MFHEQPVPSSDPSGSEPKDRFLAHIRQLVTPQQFDTWFRRNLLAERPSGNVALLVPNAFIRDWLTNYYTNTIAQAIRRTFGDDRVLSIELDPAAALSQSESLAQPLAPTADAPPHNEAPTPTAAAPLPLQLAPFSDTILHDDYTFANFVVGASNRFAHAAATAVADAPARRYNPFFLHGSVGLGKTHLLQAICQQILQRNPASRILYLSCETFINHFIAALENGDLASFRMKYRNVDVLLVDDIHLLANKERTQEEFFHTFNTIYNLGHQIVISSDAPPKDIPTLQERLVSRFKMGLVVEIASPDFETRVAILKRKAKIRGHELADDVAHFLAESITSNIRELEGAVVRLVGYASLLDKPLSLDVAEEAMMEGTSARSAAITIHDIVSVVTRYFNVKLADLQSKRRNKSITFPRQVCMYLARENTQLSLEEIGGYFGGRDHTTVLYATDKMRSAIEGDPVHADLMRQLTREIRA